jgi:hypothetical protein
MENKKLTIEDLLNSLVNPSEDKTKLENTKETWERIGNKDRFSELGLSGSDLESFLSDWISENPYNNI